MSAANSATRAASPISATRPRRSVAYALRDTVLRDDNSPIAIGRCSAQRNASACGYGGFIGYNTQWQDLILGVEANYTHTAFSYVVDRPPDRQPQL